MLYGMIEEQQTILETAPDYLGTAETVVGLLVLVATLVYTIIRIRKSKDK